MNSAVAAASKQRLRVAFLAKWYPHRDDALSGIFIQQQAMALIRHCDVAVLTVAEDPQIASPAPEIVTEVRDGVTSTHAYLSPQTAADAALNSHAWSMGWRALQSSWGLPDIVHVHVLAEPGRLARQLRQRHGIPYLISEHWSGYLDADGSYHGSPERRAATVPVVRDAGCVITVSTALRDAMLARGLVNTYHVIPNVVEQRLVIEPPAFTGVLQLLCIARLSDREKNVSGMIRALAHLPREHARTFQLDIIGDGPDRQPLEALAQHLGVAPQVRFHGEQPNQRIPWFLQQAHALVCNSYFETFCIAVAEALVHGLPVIVTKCGGPQDYAREDSAILVPCDDVAALAAAMLKLRDNYRALRQAARRFDREPFRASTVASRLFSIYAQQVACTQLAGTATDAS